MIVGREKRQEFGELKGGMDGGGREKFLKEV